MRCVQYIGYCYLKYRLFFLIIELLDAYTTIVITPNYYKEFEQRIKDKEEMKNHP